MQTINYDGTVIKESKLELKEGSILISKATKNLKISELAEVHEYLSKVLKEDGMNLITLPYGVDLQVLEIK